MTKKYDIIETTTIETRWGETVTRKKIKDEFFKDSNVIAEEQSSLAKKEKNDCVAFGFMLRGVTGSVCYYVENEGQMD